MTQNGPSWSERETEILIALRPYCNTDEIEAIFKKLDFERGAEAISRKARRLKLQFKELADPVGDFTEEESRAIDEVLASSEPRKNKILTDYQAATADAVEVIDELEDVEDDTSSDPPQTFFPKNVKWAVGSTSSLPLSKDKITKFVMLNDVHVPHNIPLDAVFKFFNDFKPDYVLLVGDIVNNDPFDHWAKEKPAKAKNMPAPRKYYSDANNTFYKPLRSAVGEDCSVVHWVGNHEYWSNKAIEYHPEGEGYWEVWNNIEEIDMWVPFKQIANLGKLYFVHGDVIKGGKYHSHQMLQYYNRNIRYGHYHDVQSASRTIPIDINDRHMARCCGCLEQYNPGFMENRPHNWQHAFTYGYVRLDGNFNDETVIIVDGKFIVMGKEYASEITGQPKA